MPSAPKRPGFAVWATVLLVALPVLYVLSSGPTRMCGVHRVRMGELLAAPSDLILYDYSTDRWWQTFYRPVIWVSEHPGSQPLWWYWSLFPIRDA